ncbi:MAG: arylsulfatase B [Planctomycetota bacterium]
MAHWTHTLIAALACATPLCGQSEDLPPEPPHIVVLLADDLGWGDVGFHGSEIPTPHLDALAERGVRLEQFYVQPVCSPTRGALMTGRYPMRLGLQLGVVRPWAQHGLPQNERTLADALRGLGYATAICGKWHLGHAKPAMLPTRRGFDRQYGHYNGALDYFTHIRDGGHDWHRNDRECDDEGYTTDLIADEAVRVLAEHDHSKRLFLYVPFNAPHTPLQAPDDWIERMGHIEPRNRRVYAAMVACMDAAVGRIVAGLDEHGFAAEDTVVFFCSDNGGIRSLGSNGPLRGQKGLLYEGGVRVPAIVSWPGHHEAGSTVTAPLHIVDLYPTLLRIAGANLEQQQPIDGLDAWATIAKGALTPHEVILHNVTPWSGAIRMGRFKLVHNGAVQANATKGPAKDTWELFDLDNDLGETTDVTAEHEGVFEDLKARLEAFRAAQAAPHILPNNPPEGFIVPRVWGEAGVR